MTVLTNSAEGGTSGTTVTTGNSGGASGNAFQSVTISGTGAGLTFDNTHSGAHGSLAYKLTFGSSSSVVAEQWNTSMGTQSQVWFRLYLYFTGFPAANVGLWSCAPASGTSARMQLKASNPNQGHLLFLNSAGTTILTSTNAVPLNQWFRVEGFVIGSSTAGQLEFKLFSTPDSTTPDETQTSAANVNTNSASITRYDFGSSGTGITSYSYWIDDAGLSNVGYIGPAGSAGQTVDLTGQGIASTEAFGSPTLTTGPVTVSPSGIASAEAFGTATVTAGGTVVSPSGIASAEAFGTATVTVGGPAGQTVSPTGIASAGAFGTATVAVPVFLVVVADMQPNNNTTAPPTVVAAQITSLSPLPDHILIPGDCTNHGDNAGNTGEYSRLDFMYGSVKSRILPAPGNHDWGNVVGSGNLTGYDGYWGSQGAPSATPPHFYSTDVGNGWHVISLDSDEQWIGSINNPSSTYTALVNDLAANAGKKLIAFWHHPRFSDGTNISDPGGIGDTTTVQDIWNKLYDAGCDIVLVGHCHSYQRFGRVGKTGAADSRGIREFVVGSGGSGLFTLTGAGTTQGGASRSEVNSYQAAAYDQLNSKWFGFLKLWLYTDHYSWQFVSQNAAGSEAPGAVLDSGTDTSLLAGATILPPGIASSETFGTPVVTGGSVTLAPVGIGSGEAFGTPTVQPGPVLVTPAGIVSSGAFGTPLVHTGLTLLVAAIATAEAFGAPTIQVGAVAVRPSGIASAEAFGTPTMLGRVRVVTLLAGPAFTRWQAGDATTRWENGSAAGRWQTDDAETRWQPRPASTRWETGDARV